MIGEIPYAGPSLYWREEHDMSSLKAMLCDNEKSESCGHKIPRCKIIKYHLTIDVKLTCVTRE